MRLGRISSSCSTSGTRPVHLVIKPMTSHEWVIYFFHFGVITVSSNIPYHNKYECAYDIYDTLWSTSSYLIFFILFFLGWSCFAIFSIIIFCGGVLWTFSSSFILTIVLSVLLRFMVSDYPIGIFKLFLVWMKTRRSLNRKIILIDFWILILLLYVLHF